MVALALVLGLIAAQGMGSTPPAAAFPSRLPAAVLQDQDGRSLDLASAQGRIAVVVYGGRAGVERHVEWGRRLAGELRARGVYRDDEPPAARLEIRTPAGPYPEGCFDFWAGGLACEQSSPRITWTDDDDVPDAGGDDSGLFHWACGSVTEPSQCPFTFSFRSNGSTGGITAWSLDFGDGTACLCGGET